MVSFEATINGQKWTGMGILSLTNKKLSLEMDSPTGQHYNLNFNNCLGCKPKVIQITGDVDGPVDVAFVLRKSSRGEHIGRGQIMYQNQTYAYVNLRGNSDNLPAMFDYKVTFNTKYPVSGPETPRVQVKLKLDARTPAKKFEMSFAPNSGTPHRSLS